MKRENDVCRIQYTKKTNSVKNYVNLDVKKEKVKSNLVPRKILLIKICTVCDLNGGVFFYF